MKILFLHALADPAVGGGAEEMVWTQMRGLRDAGHQCVLLATCDSSGIERSEQEGIIVWQAGIRNLYWPYHKQHPSAPLRMLWHTLDSYNPWMQGHIRRVVTQEQPDVASLHNLPGWSVAAWRTLHMLGVPSVQVLHDYYLICPKATMYKRGHNCVNQCAGCGAFRLPHRRLSRKLSAVVGVSSFILETHQRLGYFRDVPVQRVIHNARNPIDLGIDAIPPQAPHAGIRFGYIGRLDPAKGIEPLIDAFRQSNLPDSELWIAGAGHHDYEQRLRGKLGNVRIHMLGRVSPVDFYPHVDVVVVPSLWNDNLPSVVFEAMAFGKPVIGARRGGIPEMIRDGRNGILVDPDDITSIIRGLKQLALEKVILNKLGRQARIDGAKFMSVADMTRKYLYIYESAIQHKDKLLGAPDV